MSSASVKPFTANFAALYAVCGMPRPSEAQNPLTLLVLTTCPSLLASSIGMNARVHRYTPPQQMLNVVSQSERSSSTKLPPPPMPALLNSRLMWSVS